MAAAPASNFGVTQKIKERIPLELYAQTYSRLIQKGRTYSGLCPFHKEKTPSFHVYPAEQSFKCFGCGLSGDLFTFVERLEGLTFPEALKKLAEQAGIELHSPNFRPDKQQAKKEALRLLMQAAGDYYRAELAKAGDLPLVKNFLQERKLKKALVDKFGLGYAREQGLQAYLLNKGFLEKDLLELGLVRRNDNKDFYDFFRQRIIFPIQDDRGRIIALAGRTLVDSPAKYINSSDSLLYHKSEVLYALHFAQSAVRQTKRLLIVEGYMDALRLHEKGLPETVALCGTAMTPMIGNKLKRLGVKEMYLLFDQDEAGLQASLKAGELLMHMGVSSKITRLSMGKDPDEYFSIKSLPDLEGELKNSPFFEDFFITYHRRASLEKDALAQSAAIALLVDSFQKLPSASAREILFHKVAEVFQISYAALPMQKKAIVSPGYKLGNHDLWPKEASDNKRPTELALLPKRGVSTKAANPLEKELLQILLLHPPTFGLCASYLPPEAFQNQDWASLYREILAVGEEGLEVAWEKGLSEVWPAYNGLLQILTKPLEPTQLKIYSEDWLGSIGQKIFRFMQDYYLREQRAAESVTEDFEERLTIKKNYDLKLQKLAKALPLGR